MKKNIKTIIGLLIAFIIGISTTVGAATVFNSKDITYSSSATSKTNVKDSLDELYTKVNTPWKCAEGYYCYTTPKSISSVEIGDYIAMTPTLTSATINGTGYSDYPGYQTINPSELNLWRVIKKNDDGTVDVVSEYVSSTVVYFVGQIGYMSLVGKLNEIAYSFTNENYVKSARHMGYSNQIEKCSTFSSSACPSDTSFGTDIDLVGKGVGSLLGRSPSGKERSYWLASRDIQQNTIFIGRMIDSGGVISSASVLTRNAAGQYPNIQVGCAVRPILTMKSSVQIKSGDGKSASTAYQLV